jgi:uncharacterized protein (TIGR03083 family)
MSEPLLDSLRRQGRAVVDWLGGLDEAVFAQPSALAGWDLRQLTAHLVLVFEGARRGLESPLAERPYPIAEYVRLYAPNAAQIDELTAELAGTDSPARILARLAEAVTALPDALSDARVVRGGRGPITARDWVITRNIEAVVHSDDLARSLPDRDPVPLDRAALATATRTLAEVLTALAPGRSVEVRVPPFVAVQAVDGPRHTRGTPPNVVETDPLTWVRVAAGRMSFAEAVATGAINASGQRADLTPFLPLL